MIEGARYPANEIRNSWEKILLNQFHDIIPGSSIKEVYDVTDVEYKELLKTGEELVDNGINYISSNIILDKKSVVVVNSLGFERSDIATFEIPKNINNVGLIDEDGKSIVCQKIDKNKAILFAENIPANGYKTFELVESTVELRDNIIILNKELGENNFIKIGFDSKGQIKSIIDKKTNREVLKEGAIANQIQAFEDKPMCFDNWDIDIYYKEKM